jgi:hypothetical protein
MKICPKTIIGLGALALGVALASVPAFAQAYPTAARPFARPLYMVAPHQQQARPLPLCQVWQTYPDTIGKPPSGPRCQD